MKLHLIFTTAFGGIRTNTSRSLLTILGIVIGITAIMIVMSVGSGAQEYILGQVRGLGGRTIIIEAGREPKGPSDFAQIFTQSLQTKDIDALERLSGDVAVEDITPLVVYSGTALYQQETKRMTMRGGSAAMENILSITPAVGAFFTEEDVRSRASVVVIGEEVKTDLFGLSDPIGQRIKIKNHSFRVIGVLPSKGQGALFNVDGMVFAPYTTVQEYLTGSNYFQGFMVRAKSEEIVPVTTEEIKIALRNSHNITDPSKDDFHVTTQADAAATVSTIANVLTLLLSAVAAISLVVGGIGIMNIMLVSVTERTREIGLRKALGARQSDILRQFLFEAMLLTMIGGAIGILLGALFSYAASLVLARVVGDTWQFAFPVSAMLMGLGVSSGIGLIFGLYPARQAARKSPMEALRYE